MPPSNAARKFSSKSIRSPAGSGANSAPPSPGPGARPFHKPQSWRRGRNLTRYVPADEVPALPEAWAGHQRFQEWAEDFVELTVALTRAGRAGDAKNNSQKSKANATAKPKRS